MSNISFKSLGLDSFLIEQLEKYEIHTPTDVQAACIPPILEGRGCLACAKTGSGKTLAFALPIIQKLVRHRFGVFALVLTPTRELAHQIFLQFKAYGDAYKIKVCLIIGGQDMITEGLELADAPEIVIATPGRLADHIDTGANDLPFSNIQFLVLDEADQLFNQHFKTQLDAIFEALPERKQTLLFSATITPALKLVQKIAMTTAKLEPFIWAFDDSVVTVKELDQTYVLTPPHLRDVYMVYLIQELLLKDKLTSIIVFVYSCKICQALSIALNDLGYENVALHSMIKQRLRMDALNKFKSKKCKLLIATDVASRGLDIPRVDVIINHNVPANPKDYVHRVGRTARAGNAGLAITQVGPKDVPNVHKIEALIGTRLKEYKIKESEAEKLSLSVQVAVSNAELKIGDMDEFGKRKENYKRKKKILAGHDPDKEDEKKKKQIKKKLELGVLL